MKIRRNMNDPESRMFWESLEKMVKENEQRDRINKLINKIKEANDGDLFCVENYLLNYNKLKSFLSVNDPIANNDRRFTLVEVD